MRLSKTESALIRSLEQDRLPGERVERLMSIPAIDPITALTEELTPALLRSASGELLPS